MTAGARTPSWLGGSKSDPPLSDCAGNDDSPVEPQPITRAEAEVDKHLADRTRKAASIGYCFEAFLSRTPGPPPFSAIKTMPPASRAARNRPTTLSDNFVATVS